MITRPKSLRQVAEQSDSIGEFGRHLRDWLHELRRASSRPQAAATIADKPPRLRGKFARGRIADAWLAAYAEHVAGRIGQAAPAWCLDRGLIAPEPVFDDGADTRLLRALALAHAPAAFKRRNLFTPAVDLPLRLHAGRPAKSPEEKRRANAERQRRFRAARKAELKALRRLVARKKRLA